MKRVEANLRTDRIGLAGWPDGERARAGSEFLPIDGLPDLEDAPAIADDHHRFDLPRLSSGDVATGLSAELRMSWRGVGRASNSASPRRSAGPP
jgi:hypothetical protein